MHFSGHIPNDANLIIVSDDPGFASNVTEMTLFIMMIAFTQGNPKNVLVIDYTPLVPIKSSASEKEMHVIEYTGPVYHYRRDFPYFERYRLELPLRERENLDSNKPSLNAVQSIGNEGLSRCTCGKFVGELGAAPIDRGYWFGGVKDVEHQRQKISSLCPTAELYYKETPDTEVKTNGKFTVTQIQRKDGRRKWGKREKSFKNILLRSTESENKTSGAYNSTSRYKMVVYQRNEDRKFMNFEHMLKSITTSLPKWSIEVMFHEEDLEPCMLKSVLQDADIFLTTHGFQSMSILFMKKGSLIVEFFPFKYWKVGYKPLAEEYGVHYRWLQSDGPVFATHYLLYLFTQKQCMLSHWCRDFSRKEDVVMTPVMLHKVLKMANDVETGKIGAHNAPSTFGIRNMVLP